MADKSSRKRGLTVILILAAASVLVCTCATPLLLRTYKRWSVQNHKRILVTQVDMWTKWERQKWCPSGCDAGLFCACWRNADYYLAYLDPHLLEAAVNYKAALEGLSGRERQELLEEVTRRLVQGDTIPFILYVRGNHESLIVDLGSLDTSMHLVNIRGVEVTASEYDQLLGEPMLLNKDRIGYIFFPSQLHEPVVDLANDSSFTVVATAEAQATHGVFRTQHTQSLHWRFNLVPIEIPLKQIADSHPQPSGEIPLEVILDILVVHHSDFDKGPFQC